MARSKYKPPTTPSDCFLRTLEMAREVTDDDFRLKVFNAIYPIIHSELLSYQQWNIDNGNESENEGVRAEIAELESMKKTVESFAGIAREGE